MSDSNDGRSISRRGLMSAIGGAAGGMSSLVSGDLTGGGDLYGGNAALSEAFQVADDKIWVGPDSAKSTVAAESGRVYMASDTSVSYIGDSGSWVGPQPVGSPSQSVPAVHTEEQRFSPEKATVWVRQIENNVPKIQPFTSIQAAIDAVTRTDSGFPRGDVWIMPRGAMGNSPDDTSTRYGEQVLIDDFRTRVEGSGPSTRISASTSDYTVYVKQADDCAFGNVWVENNGEGDAIQMDGSEGHLYGINIEDAGRYGINVGPDGANSVRSSITGGHLETEIKAGDTAGLRFSASEGYIDRVRIHDELGRGIPVGLEIGKHNSLTISNLDIMLDSATEAIDWSVGPDTPGVQMSNVYIGESKTSGANGQVSNPVDLRGERSIFTNVNIYSGNDLTLQFATECMFVGHIDGAVTNWGTRNVVNGYSVNVGDPRVEGAWNGYVDLAARTGVRVINYSGNLPYDIYYAVDPPDEAAQWKHEEPIGPVDLGSTSGTYDREMAYSDGTTATNANSLHSWIGSQWVRADGGNTITPA